MERFDDKFEEELFGGASGQDQYKILEAEDKVEMIKELAKPSEMNEAEIKELFMGFGALKTELEAKKAKLLNAKDDAEKAALQSDIEELEDCLAGFDEVTKDDKFTIHKPAA